MDDDIDIISVDVVIVGAGPAGLATAITIANGFKSRGLKKRVVVIAKGENVGSHTLSGAVIDPTTFKKLLPDIGFIDMPFGSQVVSG